MVKDMLNGNKDRKAFNEDSSRIYSKYGKIEANNMVKLM